MRSTRLPLAPLLLSAFLLAAPSRGAGPWGELLRADAKALHDAVLENHPGAVDPRNPGFEDWLEEGYRQALDRAGRCDSWEGYRFALLAYASGFHDGHLGVRFDLRRNDVAWPGFLAGWSDGAIRVRSLATEAGWKELPPAGSEIVSCGGTPALEIVRRDVMPFEARADLEAEWRRLAPYALLDRGNPWRSPRPRSCVFRLPAPGGTKELALDWRKADLDALWPRLLEARSATTQPFAVRDFGPRGVWIAIPTFDAGDDGGAAEAKLADLVARAEGWRGRDPIVFDVRGNGGGNSQWGQDILTRLYGRELFDARLAPEQGKTYVEWRVSPGNLAHLEELLPEIEAQFGAGSETAVWGRRIRDGLRRALAAGQALYRDDAPPSPAPARAEGEPKSPVAGRVVLLTDGACGSACLDFCDSVRLLPGTLHVGRQTFADTDYMELREVPLPSGAAHLGLPIKVYRDRPRGNNEPYTPQVPFPGDIADTAALEAWIAALPR